VYTKRSALAIFFQKKTGLLTDVGADKQGLVRLYLPALLLSETWFMLLLMVVFPFGTAGRNITGELFCPLLRVLFVQLSMVWFIYKQYAYKLNSLRDGF